MVHAKSKASATHRPWVPARVHARIKQLVDEQGSNAAFARLCGEKHDRRVADWIDARYGHLPSAEKLHAIARATDCSLDWLLGLTEHRHREQSRTVAELAHDVAVYLRHAVAASTGIKPDILSADGKRALDEMADREVRGFKAVQKWNSVFAAVITRKFAMLKPRDRPALETPDWEKLRQETLDALKIGANGGWQPPSSSVSIGSARER